MTLWNNVKLAAIIITVAVLPQNAAADGPGIGKITNALTAEECSACHMAYQPGFLPIRSWRKIMSTLPDHFGEDASLSEADRTKIEKYLVRNAADRNGRNPRFLRRIPASEVPLRITEFRWFTHEHGTRLRNWAARQPEIGTLSNCQGCHRGADRGWFDDD